MKQTLSIVLLMVSALLATSRLHAETTITRDTIQLGSDTLLVIETACAPICSSIVRVYDTRWQYIGVLNPPFAKAVFPEAYIENKHLRWRDNTYLMLDEEEKKAIQNKQ